MEDDFKETMLKTAKELESKSIKELGPAELRAVSVCNISKDIESRAVCYRGFFEGLKFQEEQIIEAKKLT